MDSSSSETLQNLIDLVAESWPFDAEAYPHLKRDLTPEERLGFCLMHIHAHNGGAGGELLKIIEREQHGKGLDVQRIRELVTKFIINSFRMAELIGLSSHDIEQAIQRKHDDQSA